MTDKKTQKPAVGYFDKSNPTPDWDNPPQKERQDMAWTKPPTEQTTKSLVQWLNGIADGWNDEPNKKETQLKIGQFFLTDSHFFNASYDHAVKPYQMIGEDGKPIRKQGTPLKYQAIKDIRDHGSLNAAFKDVENDLYLDLLIKIAGVKAFLEKNEPALKDLSLSKLVGIASLLTKKRLKVGGIITSANEAGGISDENFTAQVSEKLKEKRQRKAKAATAKTPTVNTADLDKLIKRAGDVKAQLSKADRDLKQIANSLYETLVGFKALASGSVKLTD